MTRRPSLTRCSLNSERSELALRGWQAGEAAARSPPLGCHYPLCVSLYLECVPSQVCRVYACVPCV